MEAILYIAHGTRSKKGASEAIDFIERVMNRIDIPIQEMSFLELTKPLINEGFKRCIARGATVINVVPLFLLAAGHIKHDIPQTLSSLQADFPHVEILMKDPFGVQEKILDAAAELVRNSSGQMDRLLIVARGSSDPDIHADFSQIASGLKERLGIDFVTVCFLAAAEPSLQQGLDNILEEGTGIVFVLPYLLFSGLLSAEVEREVNRRKKAGRLIQQTGPLSQHQAIEDIVIERASSKKIVIF
ncbi:sirohydrochlorin chelatase [Ferdinandcohnia quinoae]|uniref:Sirohydrochlorin chelatase n=1 Tax=Fredinandcohnia quinoae TaxID=2918902 RepID=A0AAW5DUK1_9BACI|nr:sirohydrochlorin chelatase [Fredinandcohnia sp. SECRCQ15]MCH1624038.1 sirohydrochlorin chelatase [Fredinandcohnia sp. SECRCQ15]